MWNDSNQNGQQDSNEVGLGGVLVSLKSCSSNTQIATTTSSPSGYYLFNNLIPGCYYVDFAMPTGFVAVPSNAGSDDSRDSDIDANGRTGQYLLTPGSSDLTVAAGLFSTSNPSGVCVCVCVCVFLSL